MVPAPLSYAGKHPGAEDRTVQPFLTDSRTKAGRVSLDDRGSENPPAMDYGAGTSHPRTPPSPDDWSFLAMLASLLRSRHILVITALLVVMVGLPTIMFRSLTYTSVASFTPQSDGGASLAGFAAAAAQLGVAIPRSASPESPPFYSALLRSRRLLASVVQAEFDIPNLGRRAPLSEYLLEGGDNTPSGADKAVAKLRSSMTVTIDEWAGIIRFSVKTKHADLSRQVAERVLEEVHAYNRTVRQSNAGTERRFVEERLAAGQADLRAAEDDLVNFLRANRNFESSPELVFAHRRLFQEVERQQQVVALLTQAFEHARIEEVRNTPVISILELPVGPAQPDPRGRLRSLMLLALLSGLMGLGAAFFAAWIREGRESDSEGYRALRSAVSEASEDLLRLRRFKAARTGTPASSRIPADGA
jgi:uncharacterized protein involved in exopolysaccharide biosynthesis